MLSYLIAMASCGLSTGQTTDTNTWRKKTNTKQTKNGRRGFLTQRDKWAALRHGPKSDHTLFRHVASLLTSSPASTLMRSPRQISADSTMNDLPSRMTFTCFHFVLTGHAEKNGKG